MFPKSKINTEKEFEDCGQEESNKEDDGDPKNLKTVLKCTRNTGISV